MSLFSFIKSDKTRGQNRSCLEVFVAGCMWEDVGKECRKVNMVQIQCTHVGHWKNDVY
jgi:hypothetical protein